MRLLYIEFATVFGNDWFTFPLDGLPVGSLCRIDRSWYATRRPRDDRHAIGQRGRGVRMFDLGSRPDLLLVADTLPSTFESAPLEEVLLLRDELANLVWGVERVVTDPAGRPVNRAEVWQQARQRAAEATASQPPTQDAPALAYRLATTVPDYSIRSCSASTTPTTDRSPRAGSPAPPSATKRPASRSCHRESCSSAAPPICGFTTR